MKERTLYEVLMLHPTATIEVINAVYRALAKQHHPDYAGPEGAQKMAQLNEAYAILSNSEKRARYDEIIGVSKEGELVGHRRQSMPGATNLKFEGGSWSVRPETEPTPASASYGEAGPPPRYPRSQGQRALLRPLSWLGHLAGSRLRPQLSRVAEPHHGRSLVQRGAASRPSARRPRTSSGRRSREQPSGARPSERCPTPPCGRPRPRRPGGAVPRRWMPR